MVGQAALNRSIGVRLPVSQPIAKGLTNQTLPNARKSETRTSSAYRDAERGISTVDCLAPNEESTRKLRAADRSLSRLYCRLRQPVGDW